MRNGRTFFEDRQRKRPPDRTVIFRSRGIAATGIPEEDAWKTTTSADDAIAT
jgi:hypothetical protein